jgi:hypothetical protein
MFSPSLMKGILGFNGSNDRNIGDSEHNYAEGSNTFNLNPMNMQSVGFQFGQMINLNSI